MSADVARVDIKKNTDQLNFEDFLGGVTRIVTIAGVKKGSKEAQYDIAIKGDSRYWRPPPTVLKLLVEAWTDEAKTWVGRHAALYGDPNVMMANKKVGGIRVSHLSGIDKPLVALLSETRGKRTNHTVQPLTDADVITALRAQWNGANPERRAEIEAEVAALGAAS